MIPAGLCQCGCGGVTNVARQAIKALGMRNGEHFKYIRGHAPAPNKGKAMQPRPMVDCPDCGARIVECFMDRHKKPGQLCASIETHDQALPRFMAHVQPDEESGCWLWTGSTMKGYGQFNFRGRPIGTHCFAYTALVGDVPDGLELDHLCRVRNCCNPEHLEPVTSGENIRRGMKPRTQANKTHCAAGHEYNEANTWRDKRGYRYCRTCARDRERVKRARLATIGV